jgi:lysophospholipase L1-like esterase
VAGFGNSITCDTCNDGSYLRLLGDYLDPDPIIDDNGASADTTENVLSRLDLWITGGGWADAVVILAGTPDTYMAVGGWMDREYIEAVTVANVDAMIDLALGAGMAAILVAPPPVQDPCDDPGILTCSGIDDRLGELALAYQTLAADRMIPFVNAYAIFSAYPGFLDPPGSPNSPLRTDGLHPKLEPGDRLIAEAVGAILVEIPEPSTGVLLGAGLLGLWAARTRARRR